MARRIVKSHPLDTDLDRHGRTIKRMTEQFGVSTRVRFGEADPLPTIADRTNCTIVMNGTVGLAALGRHCPAKTLAASICCMPGLAFQGSLNEFWRDLTPPNEKVCRAFREVSQ